MCELFAFSGEQPALLQYTLHEFASHGGGAHNADGWGVAHYVDGDVRLLKDTGSARESGCLSFIERHPLRSDLLLSHIRQATQGARLVRNCQPFVRELGGAMHVFAHNGDLDRARLQALSGSACFRAVGDTDSEQAFCILLERLREMWQAAERPPPLARRRAVVETFARDMRALGPANFLYTDGDALFAHGHKRTHPGEGIRPPGLHVLCHRCENGLHPHFETSGLRIVPTRADASHVLVASVPLTPDPRWRALQEGELLVLQWGRVAGEPTEPRSTAAP